ncbi:TetR/AcrR family transcriptional regulator [Propionibacteriaceae bacterium Y2011]|uniref:TetR/AcrR family transcriptional regulator n=1 Tax=Microlunatus sp. Y2014 TaxID=3418488 RepID=UPI003B4CD040
MAQTSDQNPRKQPQQRRSRATVEKIVTAAAQLFRTDGIAATTDQIALRAGVSVGSLYQYFPNKQALLAELTRRHMAESAGVLDHVLRPGRPSAVWLPEAVAAVAALHEDGDLHRVLYDHASRDAHLAQQFEALNDQLYDRVAALLAAELPDADTPTMARTLVALVESLTHRLVGTMEPAAVAYEVSLAARAYLHEAAQQRSAAGRDDQPAGRLRTRPRT